MSNSSSVESVENLIDQLSNLNLKMTTPNLQLLKLYVDTITPYDGNPHTLNIFLENIETLIREFQTNDSQIRNFIFRAIVSKLNGRALSLIGARTELNSWTEIKDALILSFGDQRNLDCLVQDLIILRPLKSESPYDFGVRCQDARSLVISKLNSSTMTQAEKLIYIKNYNDLALKTYIRGLPPFLQNNIRLRNPDSLEKAMSLVIEEQNFLYSQNQNFSSNKENKPLEKQKLNLRPPFPYAQNYLRPVHVPQSRPNFNPTFTQPSPYGIVRPYANPRFNFNNSNPANKRTSSGNFRFNNNPQRFRPQFHNPFPKPEPMEIDYSGTSKISNPIKRFRNDEFHFMQNFDPNTQEFDPHEEFVDYDQSYGYEYPYPDEISPYEQYPNQINCTDNTSYSENNSETPQEITSPDTPKDPNVNFLKVQVEEEKT